MFKSINKLSEVFENSKKNGVFIYKYSITCQGCSPATREEIKKFASSDKKYEFYELPVQNQREVSNEVEIKTGVKHQSPQLIFLRNSKAVFDLDHWDISAENIKSNLNGK